MNLRAEHARMRLCILGLTLERREAPEIQQMLGLPNLQRIHRTRKTYGIRFDFAFDGTRIPVETVPGTFRAIRDAVRPVHYRSTIHWLDDAGVDYEAQLGTLGHIAEAAKVPA